MFGIELYGVGADGLPVGPERVTFGGDNIDDAISQAELLIQRNAFPFGKASWFKIYDDERRLVYDSKAA
jgi:hypothetical protein